MHIAILGAGQVGSSLAKAWAKHGHFILLGTRDPQSEKIQALLAELTQLGSPTPQAADGATVVQKTEVIVLSTPWAAAEATLHSCGDLKGKILIDCTNPIGPGFTLTHGHSTSGAEQVATWANGARVYKSFNQTGYEGIAHPLFEGRRAVMFVCGDESEGKQVVLRLTEEVGFEAVDAGSLASARLLEPYAMLWIKLAMNFGQGRTFAFGLLRR
ncbi:MAG: NADPH-dependent F420 reductase [Thermostichus sp. BF3_bins_97]